MPDLTLEIKMLQTEEKLSVHWSGRAYWAGPEDLAYVILYQTAKEWQESALRNIREGQEEAVI